MPLKATILFQQGIGGAAGSSTQQPLVAGWSESVYFYSDDIQALRDRLFTTGAWGPGLCQIRAGLLPASGRIIGQRITKVFPRSGRSQTTKQQFPGSSAFITDVPQMAVQCTIPALTAVNVRRFSIRGIPDSEVVRGEAQFSQLFLAAISQYGLTLGNFNFPGQDLTIPFVQINTISNAGVVQFIGNPNIAPGDLVQGRGTRDALGEVFSWRAYAADVNLLNNQVTLRTWPNGGCTGGEGRKVVTALYLMDGARFAVDRIVVRKVGRPFNSYHGRRSKRRVR